MSYKAHFSQPSPEDCAGKVSREKEIKVHELWWHIRTSPGLGPLSCFHKQLQNKPVTQQFGSSSVQQDVTTLIMTLHQSHFSQTPGCSHTASPFTPKPSITQHRFNIWSTRKWNHLQLDFPPKSPWGRELCCSWHPKSGVSCLHFKIRQLDLAAA